MKQSYLSTASGDLTGARSSQASPAPVHLGPSSCAHNPVGLATIHPARKPRYYGLGDMVPVKSSVQEHEEEYILQR